MTEEFLWWCIDQEIDHSGSKTSVYRPQNGHSIYVCSSLWLTYGEKITAGVTTCLFDLQILLCYVANSCKCKAQMKGNYHFADNLLERTAGIHMLVRCIQLDCPKLASFSQHY